MISITLVLLTQSQAKPTLAEEFFFLKPGVQRYYTSSTPEADVESVDAVGQMELIGAETVYPIITKVQNTEADKAFYAVRDDGIYLVYDWDRKPVSPAMPVLRAGENELKWSWKSGVMSFTYSSKPGKPRSVFGKELPTLELKAMGSNGNDEVSIRVDQTAVYAKGVGMIEMTEVQSTKKSKKTRTVKLSKITGGGW